MQMENGSGSVPDLLFLVYMRRGHIAVFVPVGHLDNAESKRLDQISIEQLGIALGLYMYIIYLCLSFSARKLTRYRQDDTSNERADCSIESLVMPDRGSLCHAASHDKPETALKSGATA